jgi:hypothetical protein
MHPPIHNLRSIVRGATKFHNASSPEDGPVTSIQGIGPGGDRR